MVNNQTKIGVISTHNPNYKDACGVAYFAELTGRGLIERNIDIEYIPLSRTYAQSNFSGMMQHVLDRAREMDTLIIHFEPGQLGSRKSAFTFLEAIMNLNKNNILIFHFLKTVSAQKNKNKWYKKFKKVKKDNKYYENIEREFNKNVIDLIKSKNAKTRVVVFQEYLSQYLGLYGIDSIHKPIVCLSDKEVENLRTRNLREEFVKKYSLDPSKTYIGISGFASGYKGIKELISAFSLLPKNFHLVLNTGMHVDSNQEGYLNPYLKEINDLLLHYENEIQLYEINRGNTIDDLSFKIPLSSVEKKFLNRVHYINHLNDEDFTLVNSALDILVLPYYDSGQNASGPLAQACATSHSGKVICSYIRPFFEYEKYYPGVFEFVDPGNILEIYKKILMLSEKNADETRTKMHSTFDKFSLKDTINSYLDLIKSFN